MYREKMENLKNFAKTWLFPPGTLRLVIQLQRKIAARVIFNSADRRALRENILLKDRYVGSRCFILGAGSSVKLQDIKKLKGEFVISVSNTFVHPDVHYVRPRYHVTPSLLSSHGHYYAEDTFVEWLKQMEAGTFDAEMFFHIGDREFIERNQLFKDRVIHWVDYLPWSGNMNTPVNLARVPDIWSVSELAITIAVYLGFDKIYLIGIDHDWFNGPMVYFYDHAQQHALRPDSKNLSDMGVDAEFQMRRHADIFRKYKYLYSVKKNIYNANANPNHYLDVFPKVDYDSLFDAPGRRLG